MSEKLSLKEWIEKFDAGAFDADDFATQVAAGWYDWFCEREELADRLRAMADKVKQVAQSSKVDQEKMYVFFKNNCPLYGDLRDDFRICDIETGKVLFTVTPDYDGMSEVWGRENYFDGPLIEGSWSDVKEFFGV